MAIIGNRTVTNANGELEYSFIADLDAGTATVIDGVGAAPQVVTLDAADVAETIADQERQAKLDKLPRNVDDLALESADSVGALFIDSLVIRSLIPGLVAAGVIATADIDAAEVAAADYVADLQLDPVEREAKLAERKASTQAKKAAAAE